MLAQFRTKFFSRIYKRASSTHWHFTLGGKAVLLAILVSGVIGLDTGANLSHEIFSILVALIILAIIFSPRRRDQFHVQRNLPPMATMGQAFNYSIVVNNNDNNSYSDLLLVDKLKTEPPTAQEFEHFDDPVSLNENIFDRNVGFPRWVRLVEQKLGARESPQILKYLPGQQQKKISFSVIPLRRGYFYFTHIVIGMPDMLGLFRRFQQIACVNKLLVLPKRYVVPAIPLAGDRHYNRGGVALVSAVGDANEFHGLRDYQPGDPLRHIHWRSWARTGSPVVKTFEQEYFVRHALVLDTYAHNISSRCFEEAVSVAASLALRIDDQESLLDLMFIEKRRYHVTSGRHLAGMDSLLEILACVKPQYNNSLSDLQQMVMEHCGLLSNVICVFLQWNEARKAMVKELRERGVNVIVLIICDEHVAHNSELEKGHQQLLYLEAGNIEAGLSQLQYLSVEKY